VNVELDAVQLAKSVEKEIIEWRRDLHQFPELGLELPKTSAYVQERLTEMGIPFKTLVNGNAVVGLIEGGKAGPVLAIRADMDGLPINEETGLEFSSTNENMHACGHDGHTSILLGAAKVLNDHKGDLAGSVKLLFQPGEEYPGGAKPMIAEGAMKDPQVDYVIGLHEGQLDPEISSGSLSYKKGPMMASMDRFQMTINGKGAHGAYPEQANDPIVAAGQLITALQTIKSRNIKATDPAVVSITRVEGGFNQNIIPNTVELEGTVRTFDDEVREEIAQKFEQISTNIGLGMGVEVEAFYDYRYPAVVNDVDFTERVAESLGKIFDEEALIESHEPRMGGEDFAYYLQEVPGTFLFLSNPKDIQGEFHGHHSSKFDVDESLFYMGTAAFIQTAFDVLR